MPNRYGWRYNFPPNTDFDINTASPQARGLVFWLPLLGPRRGSYLDRAQGRTLTPNGSPVWTPDGWIGEALVFDDASSQYLQIGSAPVTGVPLSLSCWFNRAETELDGLITVYDTGATNHYHALTTSFTGAVVARSVDGGTPGTATSSSISTIGVWSHALAVFPASDSRYIYLNSGSKVTDTTSISPNAFDATAVAGLGSGGGVYNQFSGRIADVRIYNRALEDAEAYALYDPQTRWDLYRPRTRIWSLGELAQAQAPTWVSPTDQAQMGQTPELVFTMPTFTGNAHFNMQLDTANTFDTGNLRNLKTNYSQTGWEYWDGDSWEPFPSGGVADTYAGNNCRYTVQSPLSETTWYRRVRMG